MKQKLLILLLAAGMILGLVGCGTFAQTPIDGSAASVGLAGRSSNPSSEDAGQPQAAAATIESTVLSDQDGIVITAQELVEDPIMGTGIQLLIENNSSENQIIQCDYAVVNNFMMPSLPVFRDVCCRKESHRDALFHRLGDGRGRHLHHHRSEFCLLFRESGYLPETVYRTGGLPFHLCVRQL